MHNLETEKNEITARLLFEICQAFSLDANYMLGLSEEKSLSLEGITNEEAAELERLVQIMRRNNKKV